ncbi:MAG: hypothetical protein OXF47_04445 [Nitrospira sp.]|nr:hypothetical protein [Nitrospira sp.]
MKLKNRLPLTIETEKAARQLFEEFKDCIPVAGHKNNQNERRALNGAGQFIDFLSGRQPTKQRSYSGYPDKPWPTD